MNASRNRALAAIAVAALLGGCSGSAVVPSTPSSGPSQAAGSTGAATSVAPGAGSACDLVSAADVSTAIGTTWTAAPNQGPTACMYENAVGERLIVYEFPDIASYTSALELEGGDEAIAGLGDEAFWSVAEIVFVRTGDRAFSVNDPTLVMLHPADPGAAKIALVKIATIALSHF